MLVAQVFNLLQTLILKVCEVLLPVIIELLKLLVSNLDILSKLALLDAHS